MRNSSKGKIITAVFLVLFLAGIIIFALNVSEYYIQPEREGYERQKTEEQIASLFVEDAEKGDVETVAKTDVYYENSSLDYEDENYEVIGGIKYTPEYALGHLECVLEIPSIKMRRGVYTGTMDEIQHDLDIWMTTAAHPDYVLGKTHYCIYGHNSPTQELSFNYLKYVQPGDYFLLTSATDVYLYDVTDFYAEWRPTVTESPVCDFSISPDKCYIITCGRDQYRFKDILVVGTLRKKYTLSEWEKEKDEIVSERKENTVYVEDTRERLKLRMEMQGGGLVATLTDPKGNPVPDAGLCVTDSDGLFTSPNGSVFDKTDSNGQVRYDIASFDDGSEYVVGGYKINDPDYRDPDDVLFSVSYKKQERTITSKTVEEETAPPDSYRTIWRVLLIASGVLILAITVLLVNIIVTTAKTAKKRGKDFGED